MAEAIVSSVAGRLTDLLNEDSQLLHGVQDEIQQVVAELMRMKTFLRDADSRMDEERIRSLLADVRDLAYDAENVVETYFVKASSSTGKIMQWMNTRTFSRKITDIQRKMPLLFNRFGYYNVKPTLESPESSDSTRGTPEKLERFHTFTTVEPDIFVGFHADVERLVGHLVDESDNSYSLLSICGMGGLGKTTLAEKIYNNSTIKSYFAGLAWVTISQKWQAKHVWQKILLCLVHENKEEIFTWDDDKLVEKLLQIQQNKKCLIVLDDIWSKDAWDSIKAAFTAENSISKLMLTSRNVDIAEHVNPEGLIHKPDFLSEDQSWELLYLKALSTRGTYLDHARDLNRMEKLGKEMVKHCAGLPLAIMILGGILVTKDTLDAWEKVYNDTLLSLKSGEGFGEEYQKRLFEILVWSYNNLPFQLKPCFLYLGKFMEDEWIDAETLYQLWIAEGMVLSCDRGEGETMMQVAESYMGELVHRSMVQVRLNDLGSSLTKYKSCSLHDLMRDLSLYQAKAENFFEAIDLREGNDLHPKHSTVSPFGNTRQLVVYESKDIANPSFTKRPSHQQYRSVLYINVVKYDRWPPHKWPPRLGSYLAHFKFLRVLALENSSLGRRSISGTFFGTNMGRVLGSLVYLRYLSLRGSKWPTFPWIYKLVLLQTLNLGVYAIEKPPVSSNGLGKLTFLRHLYLPCYYGRSRANFKLRFNGLTKLETLENFNTLWCEVKDLSKLSYLRRLTLQAWGYDDLKEMIYLSGVSCALYLALRALDIRRDDPGLKNDPDLIRQLFWNDKLKLVELRIEGKLPELSVLFEQPQQLNHTRNDVPLNCITKIDLFYSGLEEDPMPFLEKIPTLRELSLEYGAYKGKVMVCSAMGFPGLTHLRLWNLDSLEIWRVEEGSMPILKNLVIGRCTKLEKLPKGLIFLRSLQRLDLVMSSELCDSVQLENGEQGPDFYKVAHVPDLRISRFDFVSVMIS